MKLNYETRSKGISKQRSHDVSKIRGIKVPTVERQESLSKTRMAFPSFEKKKKTWASHAITEGPMRNLSTYLPIIDSL